MIIIHTYYYYEEGDLMTNEKSMIQIAYDMISKRKRPVAFKKIWEEVVKQAKLSPDEADELISNFYTELTLDGRFFNAGNNEWDLRSRNLFEKVKVDIPENDDDDEEEKEEKDDIIDDEEDEEFDEDEDKDEEDEY